MPNKCSILIIVENDKDEIISSTTIYKKKILIPESIPDLGVPLCDQHNILQCVQDAIVNQQTKNLTINNNVCPGCGSKLHKNGGQSSFYHGFYVDTKTYVPKFCCSSKECAWSYNPSVKSLFKDKISPELAKAHAHLGATMSFRKAEQSLSIMSGDERRINNHMRIRRNVLSTGQQLSEYQNNLLFNRLNPEPAEHSYQETYNNKMYSYNTELIIGVDGAYIHDAENSGHNFEAMVAKIYNPLNVEKVSNKRYKITQKQCAGSTMKDGQATMKKLTLVAAKLEGIDNNTKVTGLADGAVNCWNVIKSLKPFCAFMVCILDWFHIAKRFTVIQKQLPQYAKSYIDAAHINLWYGEPLHALQYLKKLIICLDVEVDIERVNDLITYIENNIEYIVNYNDRSINSLPISSQMVESTVEHLVAERFKKKQKMAWVRNNAHNVLQVRSSIVGNTFDKYWKDMYGVLLEIAA
jgi:hypothetical protein